MLTEERSGSIQQSESRCGEVVWRLPGSDQSAVGRIWRHRPEIGHVVDISPGPRWGALLERLLESYRAQGSRLVVVTQVYPSARPANYIDRGFQLIDEIVGYQKVLVRPPAQAGHRLEFQHCLPGSLSEVLAVEREAFPWLWWSSEDELREYTDFSTAELYLARLRTPASGLTARGAGLPVIGYLGMTWEGQAGHVDRLAVRAAHQGHGYGKDILIFALQRLSRLGVRQVGLTTQVNNVRAQRLYARLGFVRTSWRQRIYGLWLDEEAKRAWAISHSVGGAKGQGLDAL